MIRRRAFLQSASLGGLALGAGLTGSLWSRPAQAIPLPPRLILPENPAILSALPAGSNKSVLIIGGGLAGMSAALELAERGYQVTLREADRCWGTPGHPPRQAAGRRVFRRARPAHVV